MSTVMPLQADDRRRVGRYRLTSRISGRAFLAKTADGGAVIVTLLGKERVSDAAARDRFAAEARVAVRVAPFCTARILDAGVDGGDPYLVTEHVPGPSLEEVVGNEGPLTGLTLEAVAIGTATGLTAIHQTGLVHGAFGPDQVVLGPDGPRVTHVSITPPYGMATPAADMLAWAHTVMFAAAGRPPVGPQDLAALPDELRAVVAACLTPQPTGRPASREVLGQFLARHDSSSGLLAEGAKQARAAARVPAAPPSQRRRDRAPNRSHAAMWMAASAACLIAIVTAAVYIGRENTRGTTTASATANGLSRSTTLPSPLPSATAPAPLTGAWSGTVHQTKPVLTVTVRIFLPARSPTGTIAYPDLGCSGTLAIVSVAPGKLTLDQIITTGRKNCPDGMITLASRGPGQVAFTFQRASGASPAGILTH
jgi:hypothetical protein